MPEGQPYTFGKPVLGQVMNSTDQDVISQILDWALGQGFTGLRGKRVNRPDLARLFNFLPETVDTGDLTFDRSYLGDILGQAKDVPRPGRPTGDTATDPGGPGAPPAPGFMPPAPPPSPDPGFLNPLSSTPPEGPGGKTPPTPGSPGAPGGPGSPPAGPAGPGGGYQFGVPLLSQIMDSTDQEVISQMLDWAMGEGFGGLRGKRVNLPDLVRLLNFLPESFEHGEWTLDKSYLGDIVGEGRALRGQNGQGVPGGGGGGGGGGEPGSESPPFEPQFPGPTDPQNPFGSPSNEIGGENPSPFDVFDSLGPFLEDLRDEQIFDSLSTAGFTGNRYGSSAQRTAAEIGGDTALGLSSQLSNLLYNTFLQNQQFALQAAGLAGPLGLGFDSIFNNQLGALQGFGLFEQGRSDDISQMLFNSFQQNQYGLLPLLIQIAAGQSPQIFGFPGSQDPSSLSQFGDLAQILAQILALFQ